MFRVHFGLPLVIPKEKTFVFFSRLDNKRGVQRYTQHITSYTVKFSCMREHNSGNLKSSNVTFSCFKKSKYEPI